MDKGELLLIARSKELKKFVFFALGGIIQFVFGYLLTYITNRSLDSEGVGQFSYYYNLCNLVINFLSFGLYASYIRIIGEGFDEALRKFVLSVYIGIAILFGLVCLFFNSAYLIPFACMLFFNERQYYYRSKENVWFYLLGQFLKGVVLLLALFFFYRTMGLNFRNIILSIGISYFVSSIVFFFSNRTGKIKMFSIDLVRRIDFQKVKSIAIPTQLTALSTWLLLFSDQYIIKLYYDFEDLGPYSVAMRMVVFIQIVSGLFLLYYPKFYFKALKEMKSKKIRFVRNAFFIILLILGFFLIIFRETLYTLLGGEKFLPYSYFFIYLLLGELFRIFASINFNFLSFIYKTKYITYSLIGISVFNMILNLVLIKYGIIFAAYNSLICCVIYFIMSFFVSIRRERRYLNLGL